MAISSSKEFIVFPNDNSGRVYIKEQAFTASGTWTVPAGVTSAQVILVGGGGGGGGGSQNVAGGGGGGGQVVVRNIDVNPLQTYQVTIGAGGVGGLGAQTGAADETSTLPGGNGTPTTFGTITVANLLTNTDFDYNILGWDTDVVFRSATGISGQSGLTVYPNAAGISVGQIVTGGNIAAGAVVTSITGNVVAVSIANTGVVSGIIRFDNDTIRTRPSTVFFNNISGGGDSNNPQTSNTPGSPYFQNLSNNILMPQLSQLEESALITNNNIRQYGVSLSTFTITNAGVPTKLPEMSGGYTKLISGSLSSLTATLDSTLNVYPGMFIAGNGLQSGTTVVSVNSSTSITLSAALTANLTNESVTVSYTGSTGAQALIAGTSSSTASGNPTWIQFSNMNSTTTSNGTQTVAGFQGVPYIPGATYTMSAYVSTNVNISTSTPILFQIRSAGASRNAASNVSYVGGSNSATTDSIDAGTANGFFVRQATPAALTNYGGNFTTTANAGNGSSSIVVADATGILQSMAITGSGIQSGTTVQSVVGTTVTLSLPTNAAITNGSVSFNSGNSQVLGSNVTPAQTPWRRISATFTTPSIATTLANSVYPFGSTPQFIHPVIVLTQGSVNYFFDNIQLEVGNTTTTWRPPTYREAQALLVTSNNAQGGNLEASHRFVKSVAGTQYSGSAFVVDMGTANQYRPVRGFIEFFDRDYNSLLRTEGSNVFLPISGAQSLNQQMPNVTYPVRVGVTATAPAGTSFMKFGVMKLNGTQSSSAGAIEFAVIAPQLEVAAVPTIYKEVDGINYVYAGQPGITPIVTVASVSAEGGGGGGTYNANSLVWQYGLEGGNNGGHASRNAHTSMTLAGGGAGAGSAGFNALSYTPPFSTSPSGGYNTTSGSSQQVWPLRGNYGGHALWNTGTGNASIPGWAGDGGYGQMINGLNSGSPLGIALGGGGGGAGWISNSQNLTAPGRGNGGGGKGGGTWIVNQSAASADYYARGLDGITNTGGGGGGGGSNWSNDPATFINHASANVAVNYEAISAEYFKWTPIYNATILISAQAGFYGANVLRTTIQDVGNAKITTTWQSFPILPRIPLFFTGVAARLTTAPAGVTSPLFPGLAKRVRPTVRWKDERNILIREDRPDYNIVFAGTNAITYLGIAGATSGSWLTLQAPDNAAFFDVCWEFLYFDAGDIVDVDLGGCQYQGYKADGGYGADGYALIRWYDKAVL